MASAKSEYQQWKRDSAAVGCAFARLISGRLAEHGQEIVTINASASAGRIAIAAHKQTDRLIASPSIAAACLLFPNVTTLPTLVDAVVALSSYPGWNLVRGALVHPTEGDLVTLGLTKDIPTATGGSLPSEVLAFGNFAVFPPTRRAPVVALELFVGAPLEYDPKDGVTPAARANLAHILTPSLVAEARKNMIVLSGKMRKKSLGVDEDLRAKAKVSLAIPIALAAAHGCAP